MLGSFIFKISLSAFCFSAYNINMEIKWEAFEYEYKKKSSDWFWVLWIISGAIIFLSFMYNSILFAILIFFIAFVLSLQATKKPKLLNFEINEKGIITKNKKYLFKELDFYWIPENTKPPKILLKSKKTLYPLITIPLGNSNIEEIDNFLKNHLEKNEIEEPVTNKLDKFL